MRLIDCKTLQLEEFYDSEIPPYAILPHTWEKSQEVSYQEFQALSPPTRSLRSSQHAIYTIKARRGYDKIVQSARLALANDLAFVWADTCCINKTSSAELSEAVNSMYQWYTNASVCYAYLADVFLERGEIEAQLSEGRW